MLDLCRNALMKSRGEHDKNTYFGGKMENNIYEIHRMIHDHKEQLLNVEKSVLVSTSISDLEKRTGT